ncbi:MAG: RNHCP domain-containing protein [Defluviitaleaceae bacterium]|nr:RNHCP domain-containing protein [Defluviitaleaceae bacterium]MCL2239921.1 RNHCP domain-containing protein [Defluviitaleaceae bacterium]
MNRENKRKKYAKGYYKRNPCNEGFKCKVCNHDIMPEGAGTGHRNHCPHCLSSKHLDMEPGDRKADCGGTMEAIGVWVRKGGEWAVIHRCKICGHISSNRIAADDNPLKLMSMALKPLGNPPFPLEDLTAHGYRV